MRQYLVVSLLVVLLLFAGCSLPGSGNKPAEGCPSTNDPVCGTNGQTYTNACLAQAAGVQVAHTGACTAPNSGACSDGDGGKDIFTSGSVLANDDYNDDACKDTTAVKEYYCENGAVAMAELPCPGGYACVNGACVVTPCTDTDNGAIAETKGIATASGTSSTDSCASATKVLEYYCSGGSVLSREMDCGTGKQCTDGACISITCVDSDNGQGTDTAGATTYGATVNNDSCADASTVKEYYCESGQVKSKNIACASGKVCQAGKCVEPTCTDSDNGQNKEVVGNTTLGTTTHQDTCYSETMVIEYFCQGGAIANVKLACDSTDVCLSGKCQEPDCTGKETKLGGEIWYSIKPTSSSTTSITLYEGEKALLTVGSKKYYIGLDLISENTTTLTLYSNKSEEDDICSEDVDVDEEIDMCEDDDIDDATIEVTEVDEEEGTAKIKGKVAFLEVTEQDGKKYTYTGTGCPDDELNLESETNLFYPRLDESVVGSSIKLAGTAYKVKGVDTEDGVLTLEIDGDDEDIEDGDEVELDGVDYTFTIEFGDNGITRIDIES